ncbi:MAG: hypothetical protein WB697_22230, partial [Stellaceae bacterium]
PDIEIASPSPRGWRRRKTIAGFACRRYRYSQVSQISDAQNADRASPPKTIFPIARPDRQVGVGNRRLM